MNKWFRSEEGMTLVEVIVSVLLVSMVVVSLVAIVSQTAVFSKNIDMIYVSSNLAKKRMDSLKLLSFGDLSMQAPETNVRVDEKGDIDASGSYIRNTEIEENFDGNDYLMRVKVSVDRIVVGETAGHPVTVETLFADIE